MNEIYYLILLPIAGGLLGLLINRLRSEFNFLGFFLTLFFSVRFFIASQTKILSFNLISFAGINFRFYVDNLTGLIILFNGIFAFLIWLYSLKAVSKNPRERFYYVYIALTLAGANGVVLSGNLIFLLIFWNFLVFSLYGLLLVGKKDSTFAARKALTIIGVSDFVMLLGIVMLFVRLGNVDFPLQHRLIFTQGWYVVSYILIAVGALAKLGTMPLHTWIPESARVVPASTLAFIPGSLDKLLGFYLLFRISYSIFDISKFGGLQVLLMIIGAVTIVFMSVMALLQKEAQRLLAFSTVSQAGYMVLGLGTGMPIAIAGALFHMLNNTIYKSVLFLGAGAVEYRTKTSELDNLGGLGVKMPLTFFSFLIAGLAISGVPPLNGFYSKWMIYQGIIGLADRFPLWFVFLICAMFGSILTLAYNLKLVHSIFLGRRPDNLDKVREARFEMVTPSFILALACIVFGIFAQAVPLKYLVAPVIRFDVSKLGFWVPGLATILIIVGVLIGLLVYLFGTAWRPRRSRVFIGGEILETDEASITGPNFYSSLHNLDLLEKTYQFGEGGAFDFYNYLIGIAGGLAIVFKDVINRILTTIYEGIGRMVRVLGTFISLLHTGELYNYVGWIFLGGIIILLILVF
ncbi:hypothetical protein BXT86_03080 [candidate division WOR-3 bacterium 4484_100]|uniref:NADH:quinone oxidoreductase/Mrp antiporter transmembrane domain-containing protein n=1 Tax=candidate division WOR-3 bacterium 4484_100 TaxID=1936077 RepID=A0A1V4QFE6_UNCW3|nr:MAG: hypothetical protein BXT86_03080 [candidate division WOR-3 bacterium 4484_100]